MYQNGHNEPNYWEWGHRHPYKASFLSALMLLGFWFVLWAPTHLF